MLVEFKLISMLLIHQVILKDVGDMDEIIFLFFQILSYNQIDFTSIFIFRGFLMFGVVYCLIS